MLLGFESLTGSKKIAEQIFLLPGAKQSFAPGTRTDCRSTSAVALVDNPVPRNSSSDEMKNFEGESLTGS